MYVLKVTTTIAIITLGLVGIISTAAYLFWYSNTTNPEAMPGAIAYTIAMATMIGIFTACHLHNRKISSRN